MEAKRTPYEIGYIDGHGYWPCGQDDPDYLMGYEDGQGDGENKVRKCKHEWKRRASTEDRSIWDCTKCRNVVWYMKDLRSISAHKFGDA